ncbi:MAG: CRP-like cAMP-binding protein [Bradymonadia bacterium]
MLEAHLGEERLSDALWLVLGVLRSPAGVSVEAFRYLGVTALLAGYNEEADAVFQRGVEEALGTGDLVGAIDLLRRLDALGGDVDTLWTRMLSIVVKLRFEPSDDDPTVIELTQEERPELSLDQLLTACLEIVVASPIKSGPEVLPWIPLLSDLSDGDVRAAVKSLNIRIVAEGATLSSVSEGAPAWVISGSILHADRSVGLPSGTLVLPGEDTPVAASPVRLLVCDADVWESLKDDPYLARALSEYGRKNQLVSTLRQSTFYKSLPAPARESFLSRLHCSTIVDEPIILTGYRVRGLFVLLNGHAIVTDNGEEIASLQAGDVFGELDVLTAGGAEYDVTAVGEVDLCFIDATAARELLLSAPGARASLVELRESRQLSGSHRAAVEG